MGYEWYMKKIFFIYFELILELRSGNCEYVLATDVAARGIGKYFFLNIIY